MTAVSMDMNTETCDTFRHCLTHTRAQTRTHTVKHACAAGLGRSARLKSSDSFRPVDGEDTHTHTHAYTHLTQTTELSHVNTHIETLLLPMVERAEELVSVMCFFLREPLVAISSSFFFRYPSHSSPPEQAFLSASPIFSLSFGSVVNAVLFCFQPPLISAYRSPHPTHVHTPLAPARHLHGSPTHPFQPPLTTTPSSDVKYSARAQLIVRRLLSERKAVENNNMKLYHLCRHASPPPIHCPVTPCDQHRDAYHRQITVCLGGQPAKTACGHRRSPHVESLLYPTPFSFSKTDLGSNRICHLWCSVTGLLT